MKRYDMGEPRISDGEPDCDMVECADGDYLKREDVLRLANDARYTLRYGASALDVIRALGFTVEEANLDGERFKTSEETE